MVLAATAAPAHATEVTVPMNPGPAQSSRSAAVAYAESHRGPAPSGANDFDCRPSAAHPRPVILAHGTDSNAYSDWAMLSPLLGEDGYCVFAPNYGADAASSEDEKFGRGDLVESAGQFGRFVDSVLAATGAASVDIVGYSQGANVSRYFANELGGADRVGTWIGLASPTYGGTMYGLGPTLHSLSGGDNAIVGLSSIAVLQQLEGSDFLRHLNSGGDTVPGVEYTTIGSRYDEMIQPYTNQALRDPGATNIIVQDLCPQNASGHFRAPYDPFTLDLVRDALDPVGAPRGECEYVPLGADIPQVILDSNS
ncbi:MAG: lipase [Rhodococcus sp.]|nr:lipase [Rhodococcus sp. (in: high G+C Gram-positive bacteria)]